MAEFTDEAMVNLRGGDGGAGAVAFRREPYVDRGGPDGGDGGHGGDVWLTADRNVASLIAFRDHPHRKAASGGHGSGNKRTGATGADLVVAHMGLTTGGTIGARISPRLSLEASGEGETQKVADALNARAETDVAENASFSLSASRTVTYDEVNDRRFTQFVLSAVLQLEFFAGELK